MPAGLRVSNLHHAYGSAHILHGIGLTIEPGEIVCLLGPSGCGKTTLLRCVAGLEGLRAGSVEIAGEVVSSPKKIVPPESRGVGMVFQDFALFPHKNVRDNVAFGLKGLKRAEATERVRECLTAAKAADLIDSWPHKLSGGQQQRIALARALAPKPRLMLMDEPFNGLDTTLRDSLRDDARLLLKELKMATLMVTHDGEEALKMADRIILMNKGGVVLDGPPEQVWHNPVDTFSATFFGDCTELTAVAQDGMVRVGPLAIQADDFQDGAEVSVVLRHNGLRLKKALPDEAASATCKVIDTRFIGGRRQSVIETHHRGERVLLTSHHDNLYHYEVGEQVSVSLTPGGASLWQRTLSA
jgi:iron(III) transport system ATP-binding protein